MKWRWNSHLARLEKEEKIHGGCPGSRVTSFDGETETESVDENIAEPQPSTLRHWPVQLALVPAKAPFFQGADLLLTAHCVPAAYGGFHQDFLKDHALGIVCPKLDDTEAQ